MHASMCIIIIEYLLWQFFITAYTACTHACHHLFPHLALCASFIGSYQFYHNRIKTEFCCGVHNYDAYVHMHVAIQLQFASFILWACSIQVQPCPQVFGKGQSNNAQAMQGWPRNKMAAPINVYVLQMGVYVKKPQTKHINTVHVVLYKPLSVVQPQ